MSDEQRLEMGSAMNGPSFEGFVRDTSRRLRPGLAELGQSITNIPWVDGSRSTFLALSLPHISGRTLYSAGLIGIKPEMLSHPDVRVGRFVAAHERTHQQIGKEFRGVIEDEHSGVHTFFHERVIPDWLDGKVSLAYNRDYIDHKGWDHLYWTDQYSPWPGTSRVQLEPALAAIDKYFALIQKGGIVSHEYGGQRSLLHASPRFVDWEQEVTNAPDKNIAQMYEQNPNGLAEQMLTGYMLAEYLRRVYRETLSAKVGIDLDNFDEGFANFIAAHFVGISLDEVNRHAPQDGSKIALAKRIQASGLSPDEALSQVRSYEELASFAKKVFERTGAS